MFQQTTRICLGQYVAKMGNISLTVLKIVSQLSKPNFQENTGNIFDRRGYEHTDDSISQHCLNREENDTNSMR